MPSAAAAAPRLLSLSLLLLLLPPATSSSSSSGDGGAPAAADLEASLSAGHTALKKGLHQRAYQHYRTAYRHDPVSMWEHAGLQEGLCVCAAKRLAQNEPSR